MFFIKENSYVNLSKNVTGFYLKSLKELDTERFSNSVVILNSSKEACMEVYRHSLCLCLGLDSSLAYKELGLLCDYFSLEFSKLDEIKRLGGSSSEVKEGFLEACMHYIVSSRNVARKVK